MVQQKHTKKQSENSKDTQDTKQSQVDEAQLKFERLTKESDRRELVEHTSNLIQPLWTTKEMEQKVDGHDRNKSVENKYWTVMLGNSIFTISL